MNMGLIFNIAPLSADCLRVISEIDDLRTQLRNATSDNRRRWTGLLSRSTFARAIQGSNSIEGYNVTHEDAVAAIEGEEPLDADHAAWLAVKGYRSAMSYILQLADDRHFVHNEGTLRSLHYMMLDFDITKHPGRWRPGAVFVRHEPTGQIVYDGPDVTLVAKLMEDLINSLNAPSNLPVMVRAAMAHLNLVMIHPFSDGNGRMGRALQTMVLAREGILDPIFSSIEEYLGRQMLEYYAVLAEVGQGSWHPDRDPAPFIKFCFTAHYRQAQTLLRRTKEMERVGDILEVEARKRGLNERVVLALLDAAFGRRIRNSTYRAIASISNEVASKDLKALVDEGLLLPLGERRGRVYVGSEWLRSLRPKRTALISLQDPFAQHTESSANSSQIDFIKQSAEKAHSR
jgi:Fic family protein